MIAISYICIVLFIVIIIIQKRNPRFYNKRFFRNMTIFFVCWSVGTLIGMGFGDITIPLSVFTLSLCVYGYFLKE